MDTDLLIDRLKNNDYEAFNEFTEKYSKLILKVISCILKESHEKDFVMDCYNDSLLIVWDKIGTFRVDCPLVNWIATVSKYKALDYKRKLKKSYNLVEISDENLSPGKSAEEIYIEEIGYSKVKEAISLLSKTDKEIFMKRYILRKSIEEICNEENLSQNALYKRISRMKKSLKIIIEDINRKEDEGIC